jgi:hypothetical protein
MEQPPEMARASHRLLPLVLASAAGLVVGSALLLALVSWRVDALLVRNPAGWITIRGIGSAEADPLTRAWVARAGLFANGPGEAVYLQGFVGSAAGLGALRRLEGGRRYRLRGEARIPAAWWSVTLYGADEHLVENPVQRYGFRGDELERDDEGRWALEIAPSAPPGADHWLPSPGQGSFSLTMRLYQPAPEVFGALDRYPLPVLEEVRE